jgi:hypothetical protein
LGVDQAHGLFPGWLESHLGGKARWILSRLTLYNKLIDRILSIDNDYYKKQPTESKKPPDFESQAAAMKANAYF